MSINKVYFYNVVRQTMIPSHQLDSDQVKGFEAVIDEFMSKYATVKCWHEKLSYCLATFWHETGFRMKPVREIRLGKGKKYGKRVKINGEKYTDVPHIFYGRGLPQLTWYDNYEYSSIYAGVNLVENPDAMLEYEISARVGIANMIDGKFTGKSLDRYFSDNIKDPYFARRIVNGMKIDKKNPKNKIDGPAKNIEKYYYKFLSAIQLCPNP